MFIIKFCLELFVINHILVNIQARPFPPTPYFNDNTFIVKKKN